MIALYLFCLLLGHRDLDQRLTAVLDHRSLFVLGIADNLKPLPWSMVNSGPPDRPLINRLLPLEYYENADRERNRRLYGYDSVRLKPTMVVLHFTVIDDAEAVINAFSRETGLAVGNQPSITSLVSVHYMVDKDGTIFKLAHDDRTTSGTYGVDYCALAIEMVAKDEADLMTRPIQLLATFHLVDRLLKKHKIPIWRVFSHQEVALGVVVLPEYRDRADTVHPWFYPKPHFRYDPGPQIMAWMREFLLRKHGLWQNHPASKKGV